MPYKLVNISTVGDDVVMTLECRLPISRIAGSLGLELEGPSEGHVAEKMAKPGRRKRLAKPLKKMSKEEKREYKHKKYLARKAEAAGNSGPATPKDIAVLEVLERTGQKIKKLKEELGVEIPERK